MPKPSVPIRPLTDTSAARWLTAGLVGDERTIRAFVPPGFASYVRVSAAGAAVPEPMGTVDPAVAAALADILRGSTATPETCYFALWEGYADEYQGQPTVTLPPDRGMHLFAGSVNDASRQLGDRLPMRWWPDDHAWCVGGYMYGRSLYVGGSAEVTAAILASELLTAWPVDLSHVRPDEYE